MEFREDIMTNGKDILGRELTEKEINEIEEAMQARYVMYCEDYDEDVDIDELFNEGFYDSLKEIIDEMIDEITNKFIQAFKNVYNYDAADELYFDDEKFSEEIESLISDYDDDFANEERMAKDVLDILHQHQYGDTSDANDLDRIREDLHKRFPEGR